MYKRQDLDSPVSEDDVSEDSDGEDIDLGDELAEDTDTYSEDIALADSDEDVKEDDFSFNVSQEEEQDFQDGIYDRSVLGSSGSMDGDDSIQKQDQDGDGGGNSDGDPLESDDDNTL